MSRRIKPEKREINPDARFNNLHIQMMINRIMLNGKKSTVTDWFMMPLIKSPRKPQGWYRVFEQALKNASR
jgi:small subunit ribosomal protein S7